MYSHHHGDILTPKVLADIWKQELFLHKLLFEQVLDARELKSLHSCLCKQESVSIGFVVDFQIAQNLRKERSSAHIRVLR